VQADKNILVRFSFLGRGLFILLAMVLAACGTQEKQPVNVTADGVAVKGYDPVAYFTEGEPRQGKSEFAFSWQDATWRFASQEHLDMFKADPRKYAPQYGGY